MTRPRRKSGVRQRSRSARLAVAQDDEHCQAVRRWLDEAVLGLDLCPWAVEADERASIRIVTTAATTEEGVCEDLLREAARLPGPQAEPAPGQPVTTLLVCPHVVAWSEFGIFHAFYAEELDSGCAFLDDYGLKVVAFHPGYALAGGSISEGDEFALADESGFALRGTVLAAWAGVDDEGEELFAVRMEDGEEHLLPRSLVASVVGAGGDGEEDLARNWASRSPRPVLHLLRMADLERVSEDGVREAVLDRNEERLRCLGHKGLEALLQRCG